MSVANLTLKTDKGSGCGSAYIGTSTSTEQTITIPNNNSYRFYLRSTPINSNYVFSRWTYSVSGQDTSFDDAVEIRFNSGTQTQQQAEVQIYYYEVVSPSTNTSGTVKFTASYVYMPTNVVSIKPTKSSPVNGYLTGGGLYKQGQQVSVSAVPASGYKTKSWKVTNSNTGAVPTDLYPSTSSTSCSFVMLGYPVTVEATFERTAQYVVSTSVSPSGAGSLSVLNGPAQYQGSTVQVTATPSSSSYVFTGFSVSPAWSGQDLQVDGNKCTFTMPAMNITVTGNFQKRYTISKVSNPAGAGTVTISGGATASSALQGQNISASATISDPSYLWLGNWTVKDSDGADVPFTLTSKTCKFTMPAKNVTVTANFEGDSPTPTSNYTLSLSSSGNGTVSGGGTYAAGTSVSAQATPSNNYHFVSWTENGSIASSVNPYTFTLNSDRSLVANFAQNAAGTSTITVSSGNTSQGTVTGGGTYQQGQSVTITANPKPGYKFVNWTSGGSVISTSNPYTFTVGTSNQTIVANFAPIVYNIVWDYDGGTADFSDLVYDPLSGGYTLTVNNSDASSGKYTYLYNPLTLAYNFSNYGLNGGNVREFFCCRAPKKTGYTFIGWQMTGITDDSGIKKAYYSAEGEERALWHEISGTSFNTSNLMSSQISNPFRYLRTTEGTVIFKALYEYAQGWIPVQVKIRKNGDWEDVPVRMRQTT